MGLQEPDGLDGIQARVEHAVMSGAEARKVLRGIVAGVVVEVCDRETRRKLKPTYGTASEWALSVEDAPGLRLSPDEGAVGRWGRWGHWGYQRSPERVRLRFTRSAAMRSSAARTWSMPYIPPQHHGLE